MSQAHAFNGSRFKQQSEPLPETMSTTFKDVVKSKKPKEGIAFDDEVPNIGPEIYILRMKGQTKLTFTIWGERPRGIWVHWMGVKSEPHYRDHENCPGCQKGHERRWKGFLHCYCVEKRQEVFLELTPASARSLADQLNDRASMRGMVIQVKRTTGDNGRLYISLLTPVATTAILPAEKDPRPSILRLWGISEEDAARWLNTEAGTGEDAQFS